MKRFGFMVLIIVSIWNAGISCAQEAMKIVYFDNYPPFSWKDDQGVMQGILIDVLNEALQTRMGIRLSHAGYPWARAQKSVMEGGADAFVTVPTDERREYTEISTEPVLTAEVTIFTRKGHPKMDAFKKIKTYSGLKGFYLLDYIGDGWGDMKMAGFKRDFCNRIDNVFLMLTAGRGDLFVQNSPVSNYVINKLKLRDQIVELPNVLDSLPFNLCVGKKSSYVSILADFDKALKQMKESGKLDELCNKYYSPDRSFSQ